MLSKTCWSSLCRRYRAATGLEPLPVTPEGVALAAAVPPAGGGGVAGLPLLVKARRDALQEGVRWGEPAIFFLAPGLVSWLVPLVEGEVVRGGLAAGPVVPEEEGDDRQAAVNCLVEAGARRAEAAAFVRQVPAWPQQQIRPAAERLAADFYAMSGWRPSLLERNHANALQQRQIAETIHERKEDGRQRPPLMQEERRLLSLMRVGDQAGARKDLNRMLAGIFLDAPRLPVLQARAMELIGYLVRAAVEDSPLQEPLLARHLQWLERIVAAREFEPLCAAIRDMLDDFMECIRVHGINRGNRHVQAALDYLAGHYREPVRLADLAAAAGLSRFHLSRLVKGVTGLTLPQHLRGFRIREGCRLLVETELGSAELAFQLGFTDQSHFIRQFREVTGITPRRYREERRGAAGQRLPRARPLPTR
ncbi:MAG: AraC family transcriptional regulator [Lentisphaeria bacterium]|jgi:AraC-like DNA-binding protein